MTDACDEYLTHKPLVVDIRIGKQKKTVRELHATTDFAKLIEYEIQKTIDEARSKELGDKEREDNTDEHWASRSTIVNIDSNRLYVARTPRYDGTS